MKTTLILFTALFSFQCFSFQAIAQQAVKYTNNPNHLPKESKNSFLQTVDGVTGDSIIQKYIMALGGVQQLQTIQSLDFNGSIMVGSTHLNFSERKQAPNLDYIALSVDNDTIMRSVFNGQSGYNQHVGEKISLTSEEIREKNEDYLGLFNQIFYLDSGKSFALNKIAKISDNGVPLYQLDIAMPSGKIVSEFYDVQSFLLVKTIERDTIRGAVTITTKYFSNYKKINGIQFPSKMDILKSEDGKEQLFHVAIDATQINLPEE